MSEGVASSRVAAASTSNGMSAAVCAKPFDIPKHEIWEAYKRIKVNGGGPGIDGQSISDFEKNLSGNLYKIWNRLSSGTYFPPPVRRVDIPKGDGKTRPLGIPTVADRIAQMVVARRLQPSLEPVFHTDSYGYRIGKSARDALDAARRRCWRFDWVLDLDIKAFFDTIDHTLLMRAVEKHAADAWSVLYIARWLEAPMQMPDGSLVERRTGTPQGGVISPLLANLFMHYAFDLWMTRECPSLPFERYADDIICHCSSERQAIFLKKRISERFAECSLQLHPEKTIIAYCRDARRQGGYSRVAFDFLGFTFRPRQVVDKAGEKFVGFTPAISQKSLKAIRKEMHGWRFHRHSDISLEEIARRINPVVRGWMNYYGSFTRSALGKVADDIDKLLARWVMMKFNNLRRRKRQARKWVYSVRKRQRHLFSHWNLSVA
jgi:RNA-directed DNA polymerase